MRLQAGPDLQALAAFPKNCRPMAKKLKLDIGYTPEFRLTGIFSTQKNYRLCWLLNNQLKMDLRWLKDFPYVPYKQEKESLFPFYYHESQRLRTRYLLLENRSPGGLLLPTPKNLDYLFLSWHPDIGADLDGLLRQIRGTPGVQAAYLLDGQLTEKARGVLYDFELFLSEVM